MEQRPHLELILRQKGRAKLSGGGQLSDESKENSKHPSSHASKLRQQSAAAISDWSERQKLREAELRPVLPKGVPLLLKIDVEADVDFVRTAFGFEILCQQEDGFLLVATGDIDLRKLEEVLEKFVAKVRGGGSAAKLYGVLEESDRLSRILAPELLRAWPTLSKDLDYVVDLSVECLGAAELPELKDPEDDESNEHWIQRQERHRFKCNEIFRQWDELREERIAALAALVAHYGGEIQGDMDESRVGARLPDSVSVRVRIQGDGLRDIAQNFPFLFEATFPEDIAQPASLNGESLDTTRVQLTGPVPNAPTVCVVDSGIQEGHILLQPAVAAKSSKCFIPGETMVADAVEPDGHGTRVAGAVLYPKGIPTAGTYELPCWLQNARVLDPSNKLPESLYPPSLLRSVVESFANGGTRLFVHAINASVASRTTYMSAWAAAMDALCAERDVLVIQAAGNVPHTSSNPSQPSVAEHFAHGRYYPDYLAEASSRIANPGQSLHAVTVGSVAAKYVETGGWKTIAKDDQPSAFSRVGPGMWGAIKPDVVEYGGDYGVDAATPPSVRVPAALREAYPELVRRTATPGPAFSRDTCGTSFSAPKVAHIAARLAAELPSETALTHRALLVNSARWPAWTADVPPEQRCAVLHRIGFGIPDVERATYSTPQRVTLFASGQPRVMPREAHVYQVRVPNSLRAVALSCRVLVEVTLAYTAMPRRTRRSHRSYLSTWVDWKTSKLGEGASAFLRRVLKEADSSSTGDSGSVFKWTLSDRGDRGEVAETRRNCGSVQKDWAFVPGDDLPKDFCIAVVGHPGWDRRLDAGAPYALCVTFDVQGENFDLHNDIEVGLDELRLELGSLRVQVPVPKR